MLKTVRICGLATAGFGLVSLLGWLLKIPVLASLGPGRIPMAPSTALLFLLYGTATALRARLPLDPAVRIFGVGVCSAGALAALLLGVFSFLGIRPAAELLGFPVIATVGETPVGHMSPVTAMCFLLASASFLGSLPSLSGRPWRTAAAWWAACLLLATTSVMLLAYLLGSPLFSTGFVLNAGPLIPPAATTCLAFAALGWALLTLANQAGPPARTTGPAARFPRTLILVFVVFAVGIVALGGFYLRTEEKRQDAQLKLELTQVAGLKTSELQQWRFERLGDASHFLDNAAFSALAQRVLDSRADPEARAELRAWLTRIQTGSAYDQVSLLDSGGAGRLVVPEGRVAVPSVIAGRVPEVLRSGKALIEDFYRSEHDRRTYLSVLVPIFDRQRRGLGAVALRVDPDAYLYPLIKRWPTSAQSAETLLVRRDGADALYLNEVKYRKDTALNLRIPLASREVAAVKAVLGQEGIVEGIDYRGAAVIAALRRVPNSPWFLVIRMDVAEANAPIGERLWMMVLLVGVLLSAAGGAGAMLWRGEQDREFRKRQAADHERALLIEGITDYAIMLLDLRGQVLTWNSGAERIMGYRSDEIAGRHFSCFFPEDDIARGEPARELETAAREGKARDEGWRVRKDGSRFWANVIVTSLRGENGRVWAFAKVTRDLTEQRRAETQIQRLNRVYAVLSDVNQAIVRVRDPQALFAEACRIAVERGGFKMAWLGLLGADTPDVRPVAHAGMAGGYLEKLRIVLRDDPLGKGPVGTALREGVRQVCNDIEGDPHMAPWRDDALAMGYRAVAAFPLRVKGKTVGAFNLYSDQPGFFDLEELQLLDEMAMDLSFAMEMDWTEKVRLQLAAAVDQSPVSVVITDTAGTIEYVNPAFTRITGYAPEEALGQNPRILKSGKQEPASYQELWASITAGRNWHGELLNRRKDGSLYPQEMTITPIRGATGIVQHFVAIAQDVTERMEAERTLQASLREKEALLKEVHHRVKNNLQIITSLLRIETRRSVHDATKSVLTQMQHRIQSMALLHETLYRSGNLARVDLSLYLGQLADQLAHSLALRPGAVRLNLDLAPVFADIDKAIPCGLIVNELVSNSLKHGFPEGVAGEVRVRLHRADDGTTYALSVSDNGAGLPPDFEQRRNGSLGMQLVSDLARQLQGSLKIGPAPEAVFEVTFSVTRTGEIARPREQKSQGIP